VEGYSVCLWTEFGDCISGGRFDFVLFLPLFLIVVFSANRWHTRLRTHINTRLRRPNTRQTRRCGPPTWRSAWEKFPEMGDFIGRKFKGPGDVEVVCFVSPFIFLFLLFPPTPSLRFFFTMNRFLPALTPTLSLLHPPRPSFTLTLSRASSPCRPAP
jgi:hypothetical protein